MTLHRRDFLKASTLTFGALSFFPKWAFANLGSDWAKTAQAQADFVVFVRAVGGWDVTLGIDPQTMPQGMDEKDLFLEYRDADIHRYQELKLGPAAAPLIPYQDRISTVNGVFMSSTNFGHDANLEYATSGSRQTNGAFVVEIEHGLGAMPFGVLTNGILRQGEKSVQQSTVQGLLQLLTAGGFSGAAGYIGKLKGPGSALKEAREGLLKNQGRLDQLKKDLEAQWGRLPQEQNNVLPMPELASLLAGVFQQGLCRAAQIDLASNLDTHSNHPGTHLALQRDQVWAPVADLLKAFSSIAIGNGQSLLDRTLIIVGSEFARTPALNTSNGKDHNPYTNSYLIAGGGVPSGLAIGESRMVARGQHRTGVSQHMGTPVHLKTGAVARDRAEALQPEFQMIGPEQLWSTVMTKMGGTPKLPGLPRV